MPMTTRLLPRAEWDRLVGTELETVREDLPQDSHVLVVEDAGSVVGCWALLPVWHLEGLYIAPSHRKASAVARRLYAGMHHLMAACGIRAAVTASMSDEVNALLAHVGAFPMPGSAFVVPVKES